MRKKLLCLIISISSIGFCHAQSSGLVVLSVGNNHLTQSSWKPYQNQPLFGISYLWKKEDKKLVGDVGFSLSFDFNRCGCSAASSSEVTYDADVIGLHFGLGKWWKKEKASFFLTGGGFGAVSGYTKYITQPGNYVYTVEHAGRNHLGLYIRSGADFKITQKGLRLGPFLESRISTGQTKNDIYMNVNSIAMGIYVGHRTNH